MRVEEKKQHRFRRLNNFDEVGKGFTEQDAKKEAERCLQCKNPTCVKGCPLGIDIPSFIKEIKEDSPFSAVKKIKEQNPLPSVCGRICHNENLCEAACIQGENAISIRLLERFCAEKEALSQTTLKKPKKNKKTIAIIGSGPAGMTVAGILAPYGYTITMFEAMHLPGGVLRFGIPEFRMSRDVVNAEFTYLEHLGVKIQKNSILGKSFSLEEMRDTYDAVFVGVGASIPKFIDIPGENLNGVYSANEYMIRTNLMRGNSFPGHHTPLKKHKKTVVIGGGNLALDAARTARRMGADVTMLFKRSFDELPAKRSEVVNAQEEGIELLMMTYAKQILGEGAVQGIECTPMMLGEMDEFGEKKHVPIEDSEFLIDCDSVIISMGQRPHRIHELQCYSNGSIMVDDQMRASMKGVFSGGDVVAGEPSLLKAISDGKKAAASIHDFLSGDMF